MNMDSSEPTCPSFEDYVKPCDGCSSDGNLEDVLEKVALLENERSPIWRTSSRPRAIPVLIHALLILGNITFCILFYTWTVNYSHGPRIRFSMITLLLFNTVICLLLPFPSTR
jgi:hypothetical protein